MIKIKICGITNPEDALMVVEAGADALGIIFYPLASRYLNPQEAFNIISRLPIFTTAVGVFVNEDPEKMNAIARQTGITHIQLCGDESPEIVSNLIRPVIKAFRVGPDWNASDLKKWRKTGSQILLDSSVTGRYGGSGITGDWEMCSEIAKNDTVMLAGGLNPENIAEAINRVKPAAVDVSSGVELNLRKKDKNKVESFIQIVKNSKI